ncbi:MAG: response regulator [Candidatus Shapirobacteria bacterium]
MTKILICDDDEGILDSISLVLELSGYQVFTLKDSTNILAFVRLNQPDLILIDLWMPGLSGQQATRLLKKNPTLGHIPIIIVSANRETERVAVKCGANDFLCKPFEIQELKNKISQHLT